MLFTFCLDTRHCSIPFITFTSSFHPIFLNKSLLLDFQRKERALDTNSNFPHFQLSNGFPCLPILLSYPSLRERHISPPPLITSVLPALSVILPQQSLSSTCQFLLLCWFFSQEKKNQKISFGPINQTSFFGYCFLSLSITPLSLLGENKCSLCEVLYNCLICYAI